MWKNIIRYRRYLFGSFWTDFRFRYAGTTLGLFWFIVNPLLEALVYSVIFSFIIDLRSGGHRGVSYTLFLLIGLFPWLAFSQFVLQGSNSLSASAVFLRRLAISTDVFVARDALLAMFSLFIYTLILLPINLIFGNALSWNVLILPVLIFLFTALGFGITLTLSHLRVLFPDVGEILGVLVQLWRWMLPVNYSLDIFPEGLRQILKFNPPYYFISSFRDVFLERRLPALEAWLYMITWVAIFGMIGAFVSNRLGAEVKDQM